jgi:uncharacterized SAM-binding protein YcdF (DUF218 family)
LNRTFTAFVIAALALGLPAAFYVASAPEGNPADIDAVFVHAGGTGERVERGVEIWQSSPSDTLLVLSEVESTDETRRWCSGDDPRILCTPPVPETTLGEAAMLDDIARNMALERVAIVTSDYHLRRATLIDRRCSSVDVVPVSAGNDVGAITLIGKYLHEFGGLVALLFAECPG